MHASISVKKQEARIAALQAEIVELQAELGHDVNAEEIVSRHIKLLHQYNEAKDATQILMGRLAEYRGITIRKMHKELGLTEDD